MRRDAALLLVAAFVVRLAVALAALGPPAWDGVIYDRAARQLAAGEGYTQRMLNPKKPPRPTAFYPVGFPAALAAAYRVLGPGRLAAALLQSIAGAAAVAFGYVLARRLAPRRPSLVASALHALAPGPVLACATYLSEPVASAGLALSLALLAWPGALRGRRRVRALAAHGLGGIAGGLAALVRPTALLAVGLAGVVAPLLGRAPGRRVAAAAVTLGALALAVGPWAARNARALGAPVPVSTNDGVNLLIGTMDGAGLFGPLPVELDCGKGRRELEHDRCRRQLALARIASDPWRWALRAAPKLAHTFGYEWSPIALALGPVGSGDRPSSPTTPQPERSGFPFPVQAPLGALALAALSTVVWWVALALALRGSWRLLRTTGPRRRLALALLLSSAVFALTHAVFLGGDRYHLPLWPIVAALCAAGLCSLPRPSARTALVAVDGDRA